MCTVLLCGSFPFLPKLARAVKEPGSNKPSRPSLEQLSDYSHPKPCSKPSLGTISEVEPAEIVPVMQGPSQPMPVWRLKEKADDLYSPV